MVDFQSRDTRRDADTPDNDETTVEDGDDPATTADEHPAGADSGDAPGIGLVTVVRDPGGDEDPTGDAVAEALAATAATVAVRERIEASFDGVQSTVSAMAKRDDVDLIVTAGATEAGPADVVPEAVDPLVDRSLPGFGELLRTLAHEEVGSDVLTMRPVAGIVDTTAVFCLPTEPWAARLGTTELIVPQAERILDQANVERPESD